MPRTGIIYTKEVTVVVVVVVEVGAVVAVPVPMRMSVIRVWGDGVTIAQSSSPEFKSISQSEDDEFPSS
jgi:hypothetical protein